MDTRTDGIYALDARGVGKAYPGVAALTDVSLQVAPGEVHGIVGENGAGKSTLMKAISGAVTIDAGSITVYGSPVRPGDPRQAADAGVAMIYQELTIVPGLSVAANVFLGRPPTRFGRLDTGRCEALYARVAERIGCTIPARAVAGELSTADQQIVEIMRALASDRRLIIMDEPTASLGPEDVARLHTIIAELKATGHSVLYVSHDLDSVLEVCEKISILREGRLLETRPASEWSKAALIKGMLGDAARAPAPSPKMEPAGPLALRMKDVTGPGLDVPLLEIFQGEIIGLAGLVGSGRTRLLRALAGAGTVHSASLEVAGRAVRWPRHPRAALKFGIALAPEDRKGQGLLLERASAWNIALGCFSNASGGRPIRPQRLAEWSGPHAESVGFNSARLHAPAGSLSGGNQQKLMLARLIGRRARILLLDEPTRGIDIGAKSQIFQTMRQLASEGRTIIWASSELEEVVEHSDRIIVVAGGRVAAELPRGATVHDVLETSFHASKDPGLAQPVQAQK